MLKLPLLFQSNKSWNVICLIHLSMLFFPIAHGGGFNNFTGESLDLLRQDLASQALFQHRPRTGALYRASLPANLAGIQVSVVRLRSRTLWSRGAYFNNFQIPFNTIPVPYVRRIVIVYQDFGNWSSHYFNLPGYSLVSSVVGFMAYDASNVSSNSITRLNLNTAGKPIAIQFPEDRIKGKRCAAFSPNGTVHVSDTNATGNVCYAGGNQGFFAMVAPLKKKGRWDLWWVTGFVIGFVGLAVAGFGGMVLVKFLKRKHLKEMERQADEGVVLETVWLGESKMPSAAVTRTHPVLENASLS